MQHHFLFYLFILFLLSSCSSLIYPDRSQFIQDGEEIPIVNLSYYKSVQERPGQDSTLAIALAISGGGSRAACFGVGVMLGLEEISPPGKENMLAQVDYLSTVSGGGFAGGSYLAALYDHQFYKRQTPFLLRDYVQRQVAEDLAVSYTGVLLRANFNPRLWFSYLDDGDALEKAIDDHVLGFQRRRQKFNGLPESILLSDLFVPAGSAQPVRFPMHITNSSTLHTMTIFPFTPDILDAYQVNGYSHRMKMVERDALDPFGIPLAVGIKASGSFPVLISNTTMRSSYSEKRPYLHLIDGAMTDNIGYFTALEVLRQDPSPRKLLFIVDADAAGNRYTFSEREAAVFSLSVLSRLPSSGLDARRATLVHDILEGCEQDSITPIFFSFNILLRGNEAEPPGKIEPEEAQKQMIGLLESGNPLSDSDAQMLYELLTNIGTKYTITEKEQKLLFLSGRLFVHMQKKEILRALNRKARPGSEKP